MSPKPNRKLQAKSKVWLELDGKPVFGDGKARILEHIDRGGSLTAAARTLGMSYSGLWQRLREMEQRLGVSLVARRAGGRGGGAALLTPQGRDLLQRFGRFRQGINETVDAKFEKVFESP